MLGGVGYSIVGNWTWSAKRECRRSGHLETVETATKVRGSVVSVQYCPRCGEIVNPEVLR